MIVASPLILIPTISIAACLLGFTLPKLYRVRKSQVEKLRNLGFDIDERTVPLPFDHRAILVNYQIPFPKQCEKTNLRGEFVRQSDGSYTCYLYLPAKPWEQAKKIGVKRHIPERELQLASADRVWGWILPSHIIGNYHDFEPIEYLSILREHPELLS